MAVSIVIKIGKIKGDSIAKKHEGEIDVLEWSWGLTQTASAHTAKGASVGSADVRDLTIKKRVDSSTPTLLQECFFGSDHKEATLTCIASAGKDQPLEFIKMSMMGTVFISSVNSGQPGPSDSFLETVTLNFAKVKFEYTPQESNQGKGASTNGEFDIAGRH